MLIHVAQNGRMFELDCQSSTIVEVVHNTLAALTGIPASDQMLICGDTKLEASRPLTFYKLPAEDRRVFLFNRAALLPDASSPGLEEIEPVELDIPHAPSLLDASHPLDESSNPLLRALPSYERQFKYHLLKGQAIFRASHSRYDVSRRLVQEQQVQELALETACGNMGLYYNHICGAHKDFMEQFTRQHAQHSELLACFERDMERLRQCELHPALRSQSPLRRTLLDCVKEPALRKWAHDCTISHALFASKVGELQSLFHELQGNVDGLLQRNMDVNVAQLEVRVEESHKYIEEQTSILQSLSKDLSTVKKLVEDCVGGRLTSSMRPLDAVAALDPMNDVHLNSHLPRVETCDRKLSSLLQFTYECKTKMNCCVHTQLQTVAALQSRIRDLRNQLAAFREAMARQDEIFAELALVRKVASSYHACLAEVVRRKAFVALYMGQARQLAEKIAQVRESEVARREEFVHLHSPRYVPKDVMEGMGLLGVPSVCEVSVPEFDGNLLDIEVQDLPLRSPGSRRGPLTGWSAQGGAQAAPLQSGEVASMESVREEGKGEDEGVADSEGGNDVGKMELENAWLRSELASAVVGVCTMQAEAVTGGSGRRASSAAGEVHEKEALKELTARTAEAFKLKDIHTVQLEQALKAKEAQLQVYKQRIRELEGCLQHSQNPAATQSQVKTTEIKDNSAGQQYSISSHGETVTELPGVTEDGHDENDSAAWQEVLHARHVSEGEPMDETVGKPEDPVTTMGIAGTQMQVLPEFSTTRALLDSPGISQESVEAGRGGDHGSVHMQGVVTALERLDAENVKKDQDGSRFEVQTESGNHTLGGGNMMAEMTAQHARLEHARSELANRVADLEKQIAAEIAARASAQTDLAEREGQLKHYLNLLTECQVNCAHLENQLHKAREDTRTQKAAADRRAAEYSSLRSESVRVRGLLERIIRSLGQPPSIDSLRALVSSLASQTETGEGDGPNAEWVTVPVRVLAEKVGALVAERARLLEKSAAADANIERLGKQLESAANVLQHLAAKHEKAEQLAVLARQKICYTRFQVHELAAFIPDTKASGRYVAINRNCPNHFLADESVALFRMQARAASQSELPTCIVGQIVHIERGIAKAPLESGEDLSTSKSLTSGNPYNLPPGTTFAVVTVAIVPDVSSLPTSSALSPSPSTSQNPPPEGKAPPFVQSSPSSASPR